MKTYTIISTVEQFEKVTNEIARIIENMPETWSNTASLSECFGALGSLSPLSRPAFVDMFGEEQTAKAEGMARDMLKLKADKRAASQYTAHMKEADEAQGVPVAGSFVWCATSGYKCDGGRGLFEEIENISRMLHEKDEDAYKQRLCKVLQVITVSNKDFERPELADELVLAQGLEGGTMSDDVPDIDTRPLGGFTREELATFYTCGVVVTNGHKWFLIDSEGFKYARYIYLPHKFELAGFGPYIFDEFKRIKDAEAEDARKAAEEKAARLEAYNKRAAKWYPLMVDIKPFEEEWHKACDRKSAKQRELKKYRIDDTQEAKDAKEAERKVANIRRKNILAMVSASFPGLKVSLKINHGWGANYTLTWTDGPTVEEMQKTTDLDLFAKYVDKFDGMTDSSYSVDSEFTEFSTYTLGGQNGDIKLEREKSPECFDMIRAAVCEILPDMTEEQKKSQDVLTFEQCDQLSREMAKTDPQITMNKIYTGGANFLGNIIFRIWVHTSFYVRPTDTPTPTDPTPRHPKNSASDDESSAPAEGLELVEIPCGVAVIGDTRATYSARKQIKAHGAKWNRDAQQWQAKDAESVAALREWFGITAEPVASATTEPKETATDCKGLSVQNYRFTAEEVEQMKSMILTSIKNETEGEKTAWRARLVYETFATCSGTKKSREAGARDLALYEYLTTNDLPNWAA